MSSSNNKIYHSDQLINAFLGHDSRTPLFNLLANYRDLVQQETQIQEEIKQIEGKGFFRELQVVRLGTISLYSMNPRGGRDAVKVFNANEKTKNGRWNSRTKWHRISACVESFSIFFSVAIILCLKILDYMV